MSTLKKIGNILQHSEGIKTRVGHMRTVLFSGVCYDTEAMHLVSAWSSGSLRRMAMTELFPGIDKCDAVKIRKPESRIIGWSLDLQELVHLLTAIQFTGAKRILEIGTYDGFTALNVAANLGEGGYIHTVDLPQEREELKSVISNASDTNIVGSQYHGEREAARIKQLWANSMTTDWKEFGSPFDVILVDACHQYPYVKSDSLNAVKHVRPGGIVFWHDYGFIPDVSRAVDEVARDYPIVAITGTRLACYRSPA